MADSRDSRNPNAVDEQEQTQATPSVRFIARLLDEANIYVYAAVGACFLLGAIIAFGAALWSFGVVAYGLTSIVIAKQPAIFTTAIIKLISSLLLVLIILEVLSTVIHYLKAHSVSLRPFLFIGIISATRSVLVVSAQLVGSGLGDGHIPQEKFVYAIVELGVSAAVILVLALTLKILDRLRVSATEL